MFLIIFFIWDFVESNIRRITDYNIYVPTDFDTKEKALSEAKTAEKGLK